MRIPIQFNHHLIDTENNCFLKEKFEKVNQSNSVCSKSTEIKMLESRPEDALVKLVKLYRLWKLWRQSLTRGQKVQSRREREIWFSFLQFREEKEKPEIPFPSFERRKRNLKKGSPFLRRGRERDFLFSSFERRKRILLTNLQFREEKEKSEMCVCIVFLRPNFGRRKTIQTHIVQCACGSPSSWKVGCCQPSLPHCLWRQVVPLLPGIPLIYILFHTAQPPQHYSGNISAFSWLSYRIVLYSRSVA